MNKFEKFMLYDITLPNNLRSQILLFYNDLRKTGQYYDVFLKPYQELKHGGECTRKDF